ncbi:MULTISPECIES: hypothetical protein [Roseateles]|uniref:hypothetical protein n=1 Tax=Roseateles TaxID=93681 RepID=UPI001FAFCF0D|nr:MULTISPECIES: hypothetical protein [Roseateles]MCZ8072962.1 hypothetical protein [Roseateles sp.]
MPEDKRCMEMEREDCDVATLRCAFREAILLLMIAGMMRSCFSYEDSRLSADVLANALRHL